MKLIPKSVQAEIKICFERLLAQIHSELCLLNNSSQVPLFDVSKDFRTGTIVPLCVTYGHYKCFHVKNLGVLDEYIQEFVTE